MLLAIDIGNSATAFAVYEGQKQRLRSWRSTATDGSPDEHGIYLRQMMEKSGISPNEITAVILCSVVPKINSVLEKMCGDYFACKPSWAEQLLAKYARPPTIDNPTEAGIDRRVNAYAAAVFYRAPGIIVDFGTATTFDLVTATGAYGGGLITPGIDLALESLHKRAARLPWIKISKPQKIVGTSTFEAIEGGIFWGHVATVEGIVKKIKDSERLADDCNVIATGGFADLFADSIEVITDTDLDLTLSGLLSLWTKENKENPGGKNG